MEDLKQAQKVFSRLGWCYIAGTVAVYALQILVVKIIGAVRPEWLESMNGALILSCLITYGCGMPLIVLLAGGMQKDKIERHKMKWWQFLVAMLICYALVYVSNLVGTFFTIRIGDLKGRPVENNLIEYVTGGSMLINFVAMVVIAPIVEEYVFRKVIVDRTVRYGQGVAVVVSGLMFGLFHGNLNQFAYAVVLGAFFAFIYMKTGNLKITIAMHAIVNFLGSMVAGLILRMVSYEELLNMTEEQAADMEYMTQFIMDNLAGWMMLAVYGLFLFAVVIAGIILFFVSLKKFRFEPGREPIPKGKKFQVMILNPGMTTFCVVWLVLIVIQLLS